MNENQITAIVVDDEQDARDVMERLLNRVGGIRLLGKASGVDDGFQMILKHKPDLVFLDIQMPGKDGFQLVEQLKNFSLTISVVFVTAHVDYAIHAMKVAAFDYLLKPVAFTDLKATIDRYLAEKRKSLDAEKVDLLLRMIQKHDKISFNTRTGYIYVDPDQIIYCRADINYTEIHFGLNRTEVVTVNIGKVEALLQDDKFFRISRSCLINLDYLVKADRKTKTCELMKNDDYFKIPAPPKQIRLLEQKINHMGN